MTQAETVRRDSRSYRQGLVLGLTMAEVFLLLVFALLIALAALWNNEHQKRLTAELKLALIPGSGPGPFPGLGAGMLPLLLPTLEGALAVAGPDKTGKLLSDLQGGRNPQVFSDDERKFVENVRQQQMGASREEISDQWRRLTQASRSLAENADRTAFADAIKAAYPNIKDASRAVSLIGQGLSAEKKGEHDWPPIINLSEAQGYFFATGKAEIDPDFEKHLRTVVVSQLLQLIGQYGVGTIEVIGHTDEQRIAQRTSNLDTFLFDTLRGSADVSTLIPADNAGLGLARAVSVSRILAEDDRLKPYTILPLSGGQLITAADRLTLGRGGADKERRRIEIRLRRSNPAKLSAGR